MVIIKTKVIKIIGQKLSQSFYLGWLYLNMFFYFYFTFTQVNLAGKERPSFSVQINDRG